MNFESEAGPMSRARLPKGNPSLVCGGDYRHVAAGHGARLVKVAGESPGRGAGAKE